MRPETIEKNILFTINYFDAFDYPMTFFEVWRYLFGKKAEMDHIIIVLDNLIRTGRIEMKNGFYFLPERSHLLDIRQKRYYISEKYWNRAVRATKILSLIPFIKSVVVVNSLALFNCEKESDIDLLIITEKGKIWTTRFWAVGLMFLTRLRRHGKRVRGKICLSLFMSEDKLNAYYTAPKDKEFFLAYWTAQNMPILNRDKTFEKYMRENIWIKRFVPQSTINITDYYTNFHQPWIAKVTGIFFRVFFGSELIEKVLKRFQSALIKKSQRRMGNPPNVVFDDYLLKFHVEGWKRENSRDWGKVMEEL